VQGAHVPGGTSRRQRQCRGCSSRCRAPRTVPGTATAHDRDRGLLAGRGEWRWRESNPRPSATVQDFSGCSAAVFYSAPAVTQASCRRAQSLFDVPANPVTGFLGELPSRRQGPERKRLRSDGLQGSPRRRGRSQCAVYWHLLVSEEWLTRSSSASSTRFSWTRRPKSKPFTPCAVVPPSVRDNRPSGPLAQRSYDSPCSATPRVDQGEDAGPG